MDFFKSSSSLTCCATWASHLPLRTSVFSSVNWGDRTCFIRLLCTLNEETHIKPLVLLPDTWLMPSKGSKDGDWMESGVIVTLQGTEKKRTS